MEFGWLVLDPLAKGDILYNHAFICGAQEVVRKFSKFTEDPGEVERLIREQTARVQFFSALFTSDYAFEADR